jgi:hypothetical protein
VHILVADYAALDDGEATALDTERPAPIRRIEASGTRG